jgi:hypothetical protein
LCFLTACRFSPRSDKSDDPGVGKKELEADTHVGLTEAQAQTIPVQPDKIVKPGERVYEIDMQNKEGCSGGAGVQAGENNHVFRSCGGGFE